jgi:CO dehydrogenase nickel-insertion accessory protein CooC1
MKLRVSFLGAKGGIGKTTIALHTAFYLSRKFRVLYIDKDLLSLGSLIMGFNGAGLYKAVMENLGKEEYEYKVRDNFVILKMFSNPLDEKTFNYVLKNKAEQLIKAYVDVVSKNYDVVLVDYGLVSSLRDPLFFNEYEMFINNFKEYEMTAIGISDAIIENIYAALDYFSRLMKEISIKPLAFIINMVPQESRERITQIANELKKRVNIEVFLVPFKDEYVQYKNLDKSTDFEDIFKFIEFKLLRG